MAILSVNNICKYFGEDVILDNISFSVNKNEKIAIIGDNGEGKTTLLKILTNQLQQDSGSVYIENHVTIGYLSQQVIDNIENTLIEEMELSFLTLKQIEKEMESLVLKMEDDHSKETIEKYSILHEKYIANGGYEYKYQIQQMLARFGFDSSYYNRQLKTFSGGERTRVQFVKLLLTKPSILLLDEPTNHLDLVMIEWLEKYLKTYPGTIILVSHDQVFIDNIVDKIVEIENHKATLFSGNFTYYVNEKKMRYENALKQYNLQEKEIKRYQMLIKKFLPKPTKASFAHSLETKLNKMEKIDKPYMNNKTIHASFNANLDENVKLHICEDLTFGYDNIPLTKPLNLTIRNHDKICIMGQNGSGKTTLLNCLMANKNLISGFNSDVRPNLKYFYFDQTQQLLDQSLNLFDTIQNEFPLMDNTQVRNTLGRFLFSDDDVFKKVSSLSGGEKMRLIFALISLRNYDILYLDEPTNHLDYSTKKVISDILDDYPGCIVMVSHDRYFVNHVANKIIYLQNKDFIVEDGNYEDFIKMHPINEEDFNFNVKKEKNIKEEKLNPTKNNKNNKKEIEKIEKEIDSLMVKLDEINTKMNDDNAVYNWVEYSDMEKESNELEEKIEILINKIKTLM